MPYGEYGDYKHAYVLRKTQPVFTKRKKIKQQIKKYEYLLKEAKELYNGQKKNDEEYPSRHEKGLQ